MVQNSSSKALRSGNLAKATGVSPDTIRHYERIGILPRATRTESVYRLYPASAPWRECWWCRLTKRHCTTTGSVLKSLNRKNTKHDKQSHHHDLCNHKWRLRLCRSHCFQDRHLQENLCYQDENIQIQSNYDIYCVDPTPSSSEMTGVAR